MSLLLRIGAWTVLQSKAPNIFQIQSGNKYVMGEVTDIAYRLFYPNWFEVVNHHAGHFGTHSLTDTGNIDILQCNGFLEHATCSYISLPPFLFNLPHFTNTHVFHLSSTGFRAA